MYFLKNVRSNQLKSNHKYFFVTIIMLRFGETKIAREKFNAAKKPTNIWDVAIDNIAI